MSRDDRHTGEPDQGRDPGPDAPASASEQGRADAFGRWVDAMMAGEPLPPAMDSDNRVLLETATVVVASSRAMELGEDRARLLVDQALEAAMVGRREDDPPSGESWTPPSGTPLRVAGAVDRLQVARPGEADQAARSTTDMIPARRRADRVVRHLPWVVASIAAAAAVILFVTRPPDRDAGRGHRTRGRSAQVQRTPRPIELSVENTSRSADSLIGVIDRPQAAQASSRLDVVFADRLSGYRDLMLRRKLGKERP